MQNLRHLSTAFRNDIPGTIAVNGTILSITMKHFTYLYLHIGTPYQIGIDLDHPISTTLGRYNRTRAYFQCRLTCFIFSSPERTLTKKYYSKL